MPALLRQSTAVTVVIGPFLDSVDAVTPRTALSISQADVRLSKNGGTFAQKSQASAASHLENGWYSCALDATDTNTLGRLVLAVTESGAVPVWHEFLVVPANVYDSLVGGGDRLEVDVVQAGGNTLSQSGGLLNANVTQWAGAATASDDVALASTSEVVDAVWDEGVSEPTGVFGWGAATPRAILALLGALTTNTITQTAAGVFTLRNRANSATIGTRSVSDNGSTFTQGSLG
jgi:hypothetical protein